MQGLGDRVWGLGKLIPADCVGDGVEEEDDWEVFEKGTLEILIYFQSLFGVKFFSAVFEQFVDFGVLIMGEIGGLS